MSNPEYSGTQGSPEHQRTQNALTIVEFIMNIPKWKIQAVRFQPWPGPAPFGGRDSVLNLPDAALADVVNRSLTRIGGIPAQLSDYGGTPVNLMSWHDADPMMPGYHRWLGDLPSGRAPVSLSIGGLQEELMASLSHLEQPQPPTTAYL